MPPDPALSSTLIGSNYPCLELIFMVPKVFEPLKFDCSFYFVKHDDVLRVFLLELPHRGDIIEYTQYTIFNIKKRNSP